MKNKIYLLVFLFLISCTSSFLDTNPKTSTNTGTFYKTVNDAYRALVGCYDGWQSTASDGIQFYMASEIMSDECFGGTGNADSYEYRVVDRFDTKISPAHSNLYVRNWELYYAGIYRCNSLLKFEDQIDWDGDELIRGLYMGECRAIRAILYFEMIRLWGNVPLLTEPSVENIVQADPDDVYALIVEDLIYAMENIPIDAYPKSNTLSNDGHITRYAAQSLLARVYLFYTGYYGKELAGVTKSEVLAGLEEVISSGEFELIDEFKNLWPAACSSPIEDEYKLETTYAGEGNQEVVLSQRFNSTHDYDGNVDGNIWMRMIGLRQLNWSPYGKGWGACTVHPKMWRAYESGDTRREASIINIEGEGINTSKDFDGLIKDQREYTGYSIKKYSPLSFYDGTSASKEDGSGDFQNHNHQDFFVVRYSDVLLMAAELGSSNANKYLNKVRKRGYQSLDKDGNLIISNKFKKVEATQENIMKERMLEFAFEGIRYWDLLRQGVDKAAQIISESDFPVLSGNLSDNVNIDSQNIIKTKGLSQIPMDQIILSNGVLKQNEGW